MQIRVSMATKRYGVVGSHTAVPRDVKHTLLKYAMIYSLRDPCKSNSSLVRFAIFTAMTTNIIGS